MEGEREHVGRTALHGVLVAVAALALVGLVAVGAWLVPDPAGYGTHEQLGLKACSAVEWFGVPCPGCGVTTAVTWFARGEPLRSLATQPFGFTLALAAALALPAALAAHAVGVDLGVTLLRLRWGRWLGGVALLALASWAYKAWSMA
ncbi:MAG: DUF2752 domain-containing protein [Planctomycetota bacterium]|nr:DUF2752 domain-containing protein [Planctomycetota bacterium]